MEKKAEKTIRPLVQEKSFFVVVAKSIIFYYATLFISAFVYFVSINPFIKYISPYTSIDTAPIKFEHFLQLPSLIILLPFTSVTYGQWIIATPVWFGFLVTVIILYMFDQKKKLTRLNMFLLLLLAIFLELAFVYTLAYIILL